MNYEKKYKEAMKACKELSDTFDNETLTEELDKIFPELRESEDERIRKVLIELSKEVAQEQFFTNRGTNLQNVIAWIEKQCDNRLMKALQEANKKIGELVEENYYLKEQGEQKPADNVEPKFKVGQTIKKEGFNLRFTIVKIEDGFYYNDMGDRFPFTDQDNWELVEQKPAWSEEDNIMVHDIDYALRCQITYPKSRLDSISSWIYNLKGRVQSKQEWKQENTGDLTDFENAMMHIGGSFFGEHQGLDPNDTFVVKEQAKILLEMAPKQEWSEEDERLRQSCIKHIEEELERIRNDKYGHSEIISDLKESCRERIKWLESLKPQNRWKPSEEQINALKHAFNDGSIDFADMKILATLYEQLKALHRYEQDT